MKQEIVAENKGKILFMDDEEQIRFTTGELLRIIGYDSVIAGNGCEAINLYKKGMESGRPFDAIILDLIIPGGMGGKEAMEKLLELDKSVKVILTSGYLDDPILSNFREHGFAGVVTKPYAIEELDRILYDVISGFHL